MLKVKNINNMETANDKKSLSALLKSVKTNAVRDPYIVFKPEETQSKLFTAGYAIIYPRCKTGGHTHDDVEELYYIIKGKGKMTVGEETFDITAGDTFIVPLHHFHATENTGNTPLEIFWVLIKTEK